jgi:hypothetical protein
MPDFRHSYVGGDRPLDDDRVRRLVVDALPHDAVDMAEVRAEYEAIPDAPRRGDNAEPVGLDPAGHGSAERAELGSPGQDSAR